MHSTWFHSSHDHTHSLIPPINKSIPLTGRTCLFQMGATHSFIQTLVHYPPIPALSFDSALGAQVHLCHCLVTVGLPSILYLFSCLPLLFMSECLRTCACFCSMTKERNSPLASSCVSLRHLRPPGFFLGWGGPHLHSRSQGHASLSYYVWGVDGVRSGAALSLCSKVEPSRLPVS